MGRKRTGSFSRLKGGKYVPLSGDPTAPIYYSYTIPASADGSRPAEKKKVCCETSSEREAREWVAKYLGFVTECSGYERFLSTIIHMGEMARAEKEGLTANSRKIPIDLVYEEYKVSRKRPSTNAKGLRQYGSTWKRFAKQLPPSVRFLEDVGPDMCEHYLLDLETHFKYSSCSKMVSQLKTIFTYLSAAPNPWDGQKVMKDDDTISHRRLDTEECKRLIECAKSPMERLFLQVGYYTGLRRAHAANLKIEQFDFEAGLYSFRKGDYSPSKAVPVLMPLHPALNRAIRKHLAETGLTDGRLFTRDEFLRSSAPVFTRAGVMATDEGNAGYHALRVTFKSMLEDASVSHSISSYLTGHSLGKIHTTYTRLEVSKIIPELERAIVVI